MNRYGLIVLFLLAGCVHRPFINSRLGRDDIERCELSCQQDSLCMGRLDLVQDVVVVCYCTACKR